MEQRRKYRKQPAEVWDKVRADYLAGMSGDDAARRHDVTVSALRARATREGWSRYMHGPAEPAGPPPEPPALFDPAADAPETDDPAALARVAVLASGRAMRARAFVDARALATLAEAYWRMVERHDSACARLTAETAPLQLVYDVLAADPDMIDRRFAFDPAEGPPDRLTALYWEDRDLEVRRKTELFEVLLGRRRALERRLAALEAALAAAGLEPPEDSEAERRLREGLDVVCGRGRMTKAEWEESQEG